MPSRVRSRRQALKRADGESVSQIVKPRPGARPAAVTKRRSPPPGTADLAAGQESSAFRAEGCSGSSRVFPNFAPRTVSPSSAKSPMRRLTASDARIPVTAIKPIRQRRARRVKGRVFGSESAESITRAVCPRVSGNGGGRRQRAPPNRPLGGIPCRASSACIASAKRRRMRSLTSDRGADGRSAQAAAVAGRMKSSPC